MAKSAIKPATCYYGVTATHLICPNTTVAPASEAFSSSATAQNKYPTHPPTPLDAPPTPNGAIHVITHLMKEVVSSAAEAETGGIFSNGK